MEKMSKIKKILTLDQLVQFCEQNKLYAFNCKDTGYTLSVRVPAVFSGEVVSDKGLLFCPIKVCHIEKNRNGSYISKENMEKAMPSLKYRPFLATIHQLDNGEWDFHSHDMEIVENENGEEEVNYIEKQIGCFTADEPYLQYDEEMDKTYVFAKVAIPEEYTKAAEIIRRKNGSKVSCELNIESMSYNAKEKVLELEDFYFSGCTGLGAEKDGTEIGEGMLGSRVDLEDFSTKNNSVFTQVDNTKLIETLEKLNSKLDNLSNFNINEQNAQKDSKEGGNETVTKFEELLEKYSKTEADVTFEVDGLTDEELEAKFVEVFGEDDAEESSEEDTTATEDETSTEEDTTVTETASEDNGETEDETDSETETETDETEELTETEACGGKKKKKCSLENGDMEIAFEISHDDIKYALYNLISQYDELDNDWYYISAVYDDKFVMEGWNGNIYGQKYSKDGDNVALDGERYKLYAEYVTETEKAELDSMRANYSSISDKLASYEAKECEEKKSEILASKDYSFISETDEFKALVENHADFSVEDVQSKCDAMLLAYVKAGNSVNFSSTENVEKKVIGKKNLPIEEKKKSRYGSLFSTKK